MRTGIKKVMGIILAAAVIVTALPAGEQTEAAAKVRLDKEKVTLKKGKSVKLKVIGAKNKVVWSTTNKKIAVVTQKGKVTAKKAGSCKIVAKTDAKKYVCKVTVKRKEVSNSEDMNKEEIVVKEMIIKENDKSIYGKIYYPEKEGKYPAVIMSHGYNGINADFVNECVYFAENGYVAYAFDFCGGSTRSQSSGASTDMTIFTEKEDLLTVFNHIQSLEYVDPEQMFLFGGSQGGLVTTLVAEELQTKVKGMMLYFPALNIPDDWRKNYATEAAIPETVDFWGLKLGKNFFMSMRDFYTFENIGSYPNDVLIIYGDKDAIVPYSAMEQAQKTYQSVELVVLPNEGHGFSPAAGKKAREMLLTFMQKHS